MGLVPVQTQALISLAFSRAQRVLDPGFAVAASHVLTGSGLGTSAVSSGVLQITSTTNVYFERPLYALSLILEAGTYQTQFTIGSYLTGSIAVVGADDPLFALNLVSGTTRSANGTYIENLVLPRQGYMGLGGKGGVIADSMTIDNFTITRVA